MKTPVVQVKMTVHDLAELLTVYDENRNVVGCLT